MVSKDSIKEYMGLKKERKRGYLAKGGTEENGVNAALEHLKMF
jgi:hypothetical protein